METFISLIVSIVLHLIMIEFDNKGRILTKASDLFMLYGIRTVSMDDIAGRMGISKKTIYQYFSDKDELVGEVIQGKITESQKLCSRGKDKSSNAIEELFNAMEMMELMFRNMNPSVLFDMKKYHPVAYTQFDKHRNDFIFNTIKDNLVKGIAEGLYRPELNVETMALLRINTMMLPFEPLLFNKQNANLADISNQLLEHYLFGIVTLKGYKMALKYQEQRKKT